MSPPGLQNERTELAWHRTALSLLAAAAVITRLTYADLGGYALACLLLTMPTVIWVFTESRVQYLRSATGATGSRRGAMAAALATVTALIGATELLALAVR